MRITLIAFTFCAFALSASADTYAVVIGSPEFAPEAKKIAVFLRQKTDAHVKGIMKDKANYKNVMEGFGWLKKNVKKDDVAIIYISAHGNHKPHYHFSTNDKAVSGKAIKEAVDPLPGKTLLIVDTCSAGGLLREKWGNDIVVICACKEDEVSWTGLLGPATLNALQTNTGTKGMTATINSYIVTHRKQGYWQTPQYHLPQSMASVPVIRRK